MSAALDLDDLRLTASLRGVTKRYGIAGREVTALDGIDLDVPAGELLVVLGPSGCGKTTLLNLLGALDRPTAGSLVLAGTDITHASRRQLAEYRRHSVSFVFQSFNLFPGLSALENVRFAADTSGRHDPGAVAAAALNDVGLGDRLSHFPHQLSGGEQQRVAIARALASGNPLMLCDEPTGELDFHTGVQILQLLAGLSASGTTVIVVTHNREIASVADRIVELSSGRIVSAGPPPQRRAVADLRW
jgi:putative ABC transport system ATP-binding protein